MSEKVEIWQREYSKQVADCRVFKVREDFSRRENDGTEFSFFVVESPDFVNIIALTKSEEVVLIEQYRHGTEEIELEVPGGLVDAGEPPETAARRELTEETGYSADEFVYLGRTRPNPAIQSNWIYHFLAKDCEKTAEAAFDEHENAVTILVPMDEIPHLIEKERINHSMVVAAFYKMNARRKI